METTDGRGGHGDGRGDQEDMDYYDEELNDAVVKEEDGAGQPLNLSRASRVQLQEGRHFVCGPPAGLRTAPAAAGRRVGRAMPLDAHFLRAIDARTIRDLESMSQYLLQVPTPSSSGPYAVPMMTAGRVDEHRMGGGAEDIGAPAADGDDDGVGAVVAEGAPDAAIALSGMNSETEVMRAARALFSKRTRTLYHWMYPDTPKMQLKAVVANAWDAMLTAEKQFYVSQVLGKFGCLQSQLMVNPQLGTFATTTTTTTAPPPASEQHAHHLARQHQAPHATYVPCMEPCSRTRACAYAPEAAQWAYAAHAPYGRAGMPGLGPIRRRRGRPRGSLHSRVLQQRYGDMPSIYAQRLHAVKRLAEGDLPLPIRRHHRGAGVGVASSAVTSTNQRVTGSAIADNEFTDDPELRNEFEKFEWTMDHMVE